MWAGQRDRAPGSDAQVSHLPFAAKNADVQVGRIVDTLDNRGLLDDTLIVITADHAAQTGNHFNGLFDGFPTTDGINNACDPATTSNGIRSDCNWYYGFETTETSAPRPSLAVPRSRQAPVNLAFSDQDTQCRLAYRHLAARRARRGPAAGPRHPT